MTEVTEAERPLNALACAGVWKGVFLELFTIVPVAFVVVIVFVTTIDDSLTRPPFAEADTQRLRTSTSRVQEPPAERRSSEQRKVRVLPQCSTWITAR